MKTYKIKVTKADIKNGEPQVADACPVFLALHRRIKNVVAVTVEDISLKKSRGRYYDIPMPEPKIGRWIKRFRRWQAG